MPCVKTENSATAPYTRPGYRLLEHTADIGILAWGAQPEDILLQCAHGLCDILFDAEGVSPQETLEVFLDLGSAEELLVAWLNELIYLISTRHFFPRTFHVDRLIGCQLKAELSGTYWPATRGKLNTEVKAATYHQIEFRKHGDHWRGKVYLDL